MAKEAMEAELVRFVAQLLGEESFLLALRAARHPRGTRSPSERENDIERRQAELDRRDRRLLDALEAGMMEMGEVKIRQGRIASERQLLLEQQNAVPKVEQMSDALDRMLDRGADEWMEAGLEERKAFLVRTFSRIVVRGRSIVGFQLAAGAVSTSDPTWGRALHEIVEGCPDADQPRSEEVNGEYKRCRKCGSLKPVDAFYVGRSRCVDCIKLDNAGRYQARKSQK